MTEITEKATTRRTFLRRVGVTLGAAIGVAAFPSIAHATGNCCVASGTQCQNEPPCSQTMYYCTCPEGNYCLCFQNMGSCWMGPC